MRAAYEVRRRADALARTMDRCPPAALSTADERARGRRRSRVTASPPGARARSRPPSGSRSSTDFDAMLSSSRRRCASRWPPNFEFSTVSVAAESARRLRRDHQAALPARRRPDGRDRGDGDPGARPIRGAARRSASAARWAARSAARSAPPGTWDCGATAPPPRSSTRCAPRRARCTGGARAGDPHRLHGHGGAARQRAATLESLSVLTARRGDQRAADHRLDERRGARASSSSRPPAMPVTLAVSLHAATDELRDRLVPHQQDVPARGGARTPHRATRSRAAGGSASSGA